MARLRPSSKMRPPINAFSTSQPAPTYTKPFAKGSMKHAAEKGDPSGRSLPSSGQSMAYLISIMPRAGRDLEAIYSAVDAEQSDATFRWFRGLERAVLTLEETPTRCR